MSDYKPVKGDRVRVVLEGEVSWADVEQFDVRAEDNRLLASVLLGRGASIEKIEPPVEVFKPGDVVRSKWFPSYLYLINDSGYSYVGGNGSYRSIDHTFTSKDYEKVSIG